MIQFCEVITKLAEEGKLDVINNQLHQVSKGRISIQETEYPLYKTALSKEEAIHLIKILEEIKDLSNIPAFKILLDHKDLFQEKLTKEPSDIYSSYSGLRSFCSVASLASSIRDIYNDIKNINVINIDIEFKKIIEGFKRKGYFISSSLFFYCLNDIHYMNNVRTNGSQAGGIIVIYDLHCDPDNKHFSNAFQLVLSQGYPNEFLKLITTGIEEEKKLKFEIKMFYSTSSQRIEKKVSKIILNQITVFYNKAKDPADRIKAYKAFLYQLLDDWKSFNIKAEDCTKKCGICLRKYPLSKNHSKTTICTNCLKLTKLISEGNGGIPNPESVRRSLKDKKNNDEKAAYCYKIFKRIPSTFEKIEEIIILAKCIFGGPFEKLL